LVLHKELSICQSSIQGPDLCIASFAETSRYTYGRGHTLSLVAKLASQVRTDTIWVKFRTFTFLKTERAFNVMGNNQDRSLRVHLR